MWFWASLRSRSGLNYQYALGSLPIDNTKEIEITITADVLADGEDARYVVISASLTNDPATAYQVADYPLYETDQVTPSVLPVGITLFKADHVALNETVATFADLAGLDQTIGMIREVIDESQYYRFDGTAWTKWIYSPEVYVSDIEQGRGAFKSLSILTDDQVLPIPDKLIGADTIPIRLWFLNGVTTFSPSVLTGDSLSFRFTVNGSSTTDSPELLNYNQFFDGLVYYTLIGYYNLTTRVLDTSVVGVGSEYAWSVISPIQIQDDLGGGVAAVYDVQFKFTESQTQGRIEANDVIGIKDFYEQGRTGKASSVFALTGNVRYTSDNGQMRLLPGQREGGAATIQGYDSPNPSVAPLLLPSLGLLDDTADQIVTINASIPDALRYLTDPADLNTNEAILAFISTEAGLQPPISVASATAAVGANSTITITINHPVDGLGFATVRTDYPDIIAGATNALDTAIADGAVIFLYNGTNYYYTRVAVAPPSVSQNVLITSLGTLIGTSLPGEAPGYGLFRPDQPTFTSNLGAGSIPAGTYTVYVSYDYLSPNSFFTRISHSTTIGEYYPGVAAVPELPDTLANTIANLGYWRSPVTTVALLRALPLEELIPNSSRFLIINNSIYRFDAASVEADDGDKVIQPTIVVGAGRFLKSSSGIDTAGAVAGDTVIFDGTDAVFAQVNETPGASLTFDPNGSGLSQSVISGTQLQHKTVSGYKQTETRAYTTLAGRNTRLTVNQSDSSTGDGGSVTLRMTDEVPRINLDSVSGGNSAVAALELGQLSFTTSTGGNSFISLANGFYQSNGVGDAALHDVNEASVSRYASPTNFAYGSVSSGRLTGGSVSGTLEYNLDAGWESSLSVTLNRLDGTDHNRIQLNADGDPDLIIFKNTATLASTMSVQNSKIIGTRTQGATTYGHTLDLTTGANNFSYQYTGGYYTYNTSIASTFNGNVETTWNYNNNVNYSNWCKVKSSRIEGRVFDGSDLMQVEIRPRGGAYPAGFLHTVTIAGNTSSIRADAQAGLNVTDATANTADLTATALSFNGVPIVGVPNTALPSLTINYNVNPSTYVPTQSYTINNGSAPTNVELHEIIIEILAQLDNKVSKPD
jgi:hypothetical protein